MDKVLVATEKPFTASVVEKIRIIFENAGFELVLVEKYSDSMALIDAVKDVVALIVRSDKCNRSVLEAASRLKVVVRAGSGYDNVDLQAATEMGISVMNTPGQNSNAVAELTMGMLLYFARSRFGGSAGFELRGKSLGIHGYGNIGKNIARIAKGFDMTVTGFSRSLTHEKAAKDGIASAVDLSELYKKNSVISLSLPRNEKTENSVDYELMSSMPPNSVLVNNARKEIVDESALRKVLSERDDFAYLADAASSNRDELESLFPERVLFTPKKIGAQTAEANENAGRAAAEQVINYLLKGDVTFQVN